MREHVKEPESGTGGKEGWQSDRERGGRETQKARETKFGRGKRVMEMASGERKRAKERRKKKNT